MAALLHFRTINVCLLYEGTRIEKRNSCRCLFELWPNPTWGSSTGASPAPNPSRSCTPSQTRTYCNPLGDRCAHTTKIYHLHIHTYLSILTISRCVCLSLPTVLGPPRAGISFSFPQTHTHPCTHCSFRGGLSVGWVCEARALITCSSESLGLTLWPCPSLGAALRFLFCFPTLGSSAAALGPPAFVTMTPIQPLFLLLLGLIGAQANLDLRTAAAMGKNNDL